MRCLPKHEHGRREDDLERTRKAFSSTAVSFCLRISIPVFFSSSGIRDHGDENEMDEKDGILYYKALGYAIRERPLVKMVPGKLGRTSN